jgi:hypothetical protein
MEVSRFQHNWHMKVVRLSALHTSRLYTPPHKYSWHSFLLQDESRNEKDEACGTYRREERWFTRFWWGNPTERGHLRHPNIDGKIILQWIFRKWVGRVWIVLIWLRIEKVAGSREHTH